MLAFSFGVALAFATTFGVAFGLGEATEEVKGIVKRITIEHKNKRAFFFKVLHPFNIQKVTCIRKNGIAGEEMISNDWSISAKFEPAHSPALGDHHYSHAPIFYCQLRDSHSPRHL